MIDTPPIPFDNSFSRLPERFYSRKQPARVPSPSLIGANTPLARELGIDPDWLCSQSGIQMMSGNIIPDGASPIATVYAGHQFGSWNPQLGDGRAILLGEVIDGAGQRYDIQLKGAGQTPYSRMGDGRSPLGPVLREYLVSEGMHALGIPTTRSLGAVTTGEKVARDKLLPGAVLTRVAKSHIRVGHFQYFSAHRDQEALQLLADHVIARDYPTLQSSQSPYSDLIDAVIDRQAKLIAQWQGVGFIHGVMNTDNMLISGETIDYGPCAFMDLYDACACFSSIDRGKRYAYKNQAVIAHWNLSWFAQALMPLISDDEEEALAIAQAAINRFPDQFDNHYQRTMHDKFGFESVSAETISFIEAFLGKLQADQQDFTLAFRHLADLAVDAELQHKPVPFKLPESFKTLLKNWKELRIQVGEKPTLSSVNPAIIPRNHLVEEAIRAAEQESDFRPFHELLRLLNNPFEAVSQDDKYYLPPQPHEVVHQTFCGT